MNLSDKEKKVAIIASIVAAIGIGYFVFKKKPDGATDGDPTGNGTIGTGTTTAPFNAKNVANNLLLYMDQYGTKEDEIISELTGVNQAQFAQVITAFGKPPYYLFGQNSFFGTPLGLVGWLKEELGVTSSAYRTLKVKYSNYL